MNQNSEYKNLFVSIDQIENIKEYKQLVSQLSDYEIEHLNCLEGVFIKNYRDNKFSRRLTTLYKYSHELTNKVPISIQETVYKTYELSRNYYAILNKKNLDIEKTFLNFLYQIKKPFTYGLSIDWKTVKIMYRSDRNQVTISFLYILNTANKQNIKGIDQYLKNKYTKLLKKYSLIKNEY